MNNITSINRPFNKYISYLSLLTFLVLYIICFLFLFNKNSEILSFGFLTFFSIFFIFFIIDTISIHIINFDTSLITGYSWFVLFATMALKIASLVLVLIMYRDVYNIKETIFYSKKNEKVNSSMDKNKKSNIPPKYKDMINDYKILFIINIFFIFVLMLVILNNYSNLNINFVDLFGTFIENGTYSSFKPLIIPLFIIIISTRLLFTSAYEVYIGNELYKLKQKRVIIT